MDLELEHPAAEALYDVVIALVGGVAGGIGYTALDQPSGRRTVVFLALLVVLLATALVIRALAPPAPAS